MPARTPTMRILCGHQAQAADRAGQGLSRVVAIGNFDGVHLGHQHILRDARARADREQHELAVFTFWPHPARVLAPERAPLLLSTRARRRELLAECGVDLLIEEPFDLAFAAHSPEAFVDEVLIDALRAAEVCVGYDFTFGKGRAGNIVTLEGLLARRGARLRVTSAFSASLVTAEGAGARELVVCSSTRVRQELAQGSVERAAQLLGRPAELAGVIVRGAGRGRSIGVPTANLDYLADAGESAPLALPAVGVYAAFAEVWPTAAPGSSVAPMLRYPAAVNVGYNPTFHRGEDAQASPLSVEAHLIQPPGEEPLPALYGAGLRLRFVARLRAEQRFAGVTELVAQIRGDIDAAAQVLSGAGAQGASER